MLDNQYREIEREIIEDSKDVEIPESLKPEKVRERLLLQQKRNRNKRIVQWTASAAAFALICIVGSKILMPNQSSMSEQMEGVATDVNSRVELNSYHVATSREEVEDLFEVPPLDFSTTVNGIFDKVQSEAVVEDQVSGTNVQTEGIDEGDVIKCDGSNIFLMRDGKIRIIDLLGGKLEELSTIIVDRGENLCEMFAQDGKLILFVETSNKVEAGIIPKFWEGEKTKTQTKVLIYDISNPKDPSLIHTFTQSGYYQTARLTDGYVYTFSEESVYGGFFPCINDREIEYTNIYLGEDADLGTVMSSFSLENPKELVDELVVYNNNTEIYMGTDHLYIYREEYVSEKTGTSIVKMNYKEGCFEMLDEVVVEGTVPGPFGICEKNGKLCVLTTSRNENWEPVNMLIVLDEELDLYSKLDGIAPGETLYGSRFVEDMVYFVTFYNTDPLFAVDLSNLKEPKLLGELKITGYSDYLHAIEKNRLVGIGYEANEEDGTITGCKLSIFDATNPVSLEVIDSVSFEDGVWITSLQEEGGYKGYWVDEDLQMIGFLVSNMDGVFSYQYRVYTWRNGCIEEVITETVSSLNTDDMIWARGVLVKDQFYIVSNNEIVQYQIGENVTKILEKAIDK